jgi:lariat debranching enzyme
VFAQIAVEGCCHGQLDDIYAELARQEQQQQRRVDLLICCGDFQAVRNEDDLNTMACPVKYRHMGDFYKYYSGQKTAPVLTLFIGGNHEAMSHLHELYGVASGACVCMRVMRDA